MPEISKSIANYFKRKGLRFASRTPVDRIGTDQNYALRWPVKAPFPFPEFGEDLTPATDRPALYEFPRDISPEVDD